MAPPKILCHQCRGRRGSAGSGAPGRGVTRRPTFTRPDGCPGTRCRPSSTPRSCPVDPRAALRIIAGRSRHGGPRGSCDLDTERHNAVAALFALAPPAAVLGSARPREVTQRLEAEQDIRGLGRSPPVTPEHIGYRAIAQVLSMAVNSRHSWTVRGQRPEDPSVVHGREGLSGVVGWPSLHAPRALGHGAARAPIYLKALAHA
ncbi:TY-Chap2 family putative peptide chaperone [Demequina iriomotensis]|uniref:TY-Chap2 family putative peptide chaperone n=1 Tax=Demequina iriomotensis TaxID=1536641 RepID=UPI003F71F624